jgi:DnaK suppressor protein
VTALDELRFEDQQTALEALETELSLALARCRRLAIRRDQVAAAPQRIAAGTYGECVRRGAPIVERRLRVRPEAPFCLECEGERTR